jgi:hypothetical protein
MHACLFQDTPGLVACAQQAMHPVHFHVCMSHVCMWVRSVCSSRSCGVYLGCCTSIHEAPFFGAGTARQLKCCCCCLTNGGHIPSVPFSFLCGLGKRCGGSLLMPCLGSNPHVSLWAAASICCCDMHAMWPACCGWLHRSACSHSWRSA